MLREREGESRASLRSVGDEGSIPGGYEGGDCRSPLPQRPAAFSPVPWAEVLPQNRGPECSFSLPIVARSILDPTAPPCCI